MKNTKKYRKILAFVLALVMTLSTVPTNVSAHCCKYCGITVSATGNELHEGVKLTPNMVSKVITVTKRNGRVFNNYKIKQMGNVVKSKWGYFKLTVISGCNKKKNILIKVNPIEKIYIKQSRQLPLEAGSKFSKSTFKKKTVVKAAYKDGVEKKITSYKVVASKKVKKNAKKFVVTVKYDKYKDKIYVPVYKNTVVPTEQPNVVPTQGPTVVQTEQPTVTPTQEPTAVPSEKPTVAPTEEPTAVPSVSPTVEPTEAPTVVPSVSPTAEPTEEPTAVPSVSPTAEPTEEPTAVPSEEPTVAPTEEPTVEPSEAPTVAPTEEPTAVPSERPTVAPTEEPTVEPTQEPTVAPTEEPTVEPTQEPTVAPTEEPTAVPTEQPTIAPTEEPPTIATLTVVRKGEGVVSVNNAECNFTDNTSEQEVTKGSCKFVATNTSEYKFIQWVDSNNNVLSTNKTFSMDIDSDTTVTAVFEKVYTVTVNRVGGKGKVTLDGETVDFYSNVATYTTTSGRYELVAISTDDYNFVSWTNESGKVLSTDPNYTIPVSGDITVTVNFAETEKTVNVTYQHENSQLIVTEAVEFGESLTPPTKDIWKAEKTFAGWIINGVVYYGDAEDSEFYDEDGNSLSDAIKALTAQKQNVIITSYYVDNPVKYYSVNVSGGSITKYEDGDVTNEGVTEGTHVYLKADVPEGKVFGGWVDADDNIQSYDEEYDFFVTSNTTLAAIYSDEEVEAEPIVHFTGSKYELYPDDYGVRLYMASEIPEEYTKIEWGFLYTTKDLTEEEFVVNGTPKSVINSSDAGNADWIYDARFPASAWEAGKTINFRIYAVVSSNTGSSTIYSEIISVNLVL